MEFRAGADLTHSCAEPARSGCASVIIGRLRRGRAVVTRQRRHSKGRCVSATEQPSARVGQDQLEALGGPAGGNGYLSLDGELRPGRDPAEFPRPLEFDANGFPVPQRNSSFVKRVERLVNPL
jgi:hypothetical protein